MYDNRGEWDAIRIGGSAARSLEDRLADALARAFRWLGDAARLLTYRSDLYRSRQQLRELSDDQLADVGLTRRQAEREAGRPFFEE